MSSENEIYSVNSLSTLGSLPPEVLNYDSAQFESLTPGYLLGEFKNYRLLERLGEGGMGQTWLAEELSGGEAVRKVVVKILSKELCGHEEALAEVRRVFDLTSNLFHPNICATLGMKKDPSFGWILVMVYADRGTLSDWFRAQPNHENGLPLAQILPILRPIAEALDFAHQKGILHRDVKPQNIMFAGKTPLLIDFGIAARIRPESVTQSTQTLGRSTTGHASSTSGTPVYMAPEQMMGKPQTGRTDQYALALVLYELLAGKLPFEGDSIAAMSFQKASFNPENPNFPASVNSALRKALSSNPQDRFWTCTNFLEALSDVPRPPAPPKVPVPPKVPAREKTLEEMEREIYEKLRDEQRLKDEAAQKRQKEEAAKRLREEAERRARERFKKEQAEKSSPKQKKAKSPAIFTRRNFIRAGIGVGVVAAVWGWERVLGGFDGILFSFDGKTLIKVVRKKGLVRYTIPDSVTYIGDRAFRYCSSLTSVTIPDSVTYIGYLAFWGCSSLTSVTIPDSVTTIGGRAFYDCSSLTSVTIPDSVTTIGDYAFSGCESLTIYGKAGSAAERYAEEWGGFKFQAR